MIKVKSITGKPIFAHSKGVIANSGLPSFLARRSETVTMYTLAVDPICVPLPPIPTPNAKAHHKEYISTPEASMASSIGIIAAVKGMLSIAADITAATHINTIVANKIDGGRPA